LIGKFHTIEYWEKGARERALAAKQTPQKDGAKGSMAPMKHKEHSAASVEEMTHNKRLKTASVDTPPPGLPSFTNQGKHWEAIPKPHVVPKVKGQPIESAQYPDSVPRPPPPCDLHGRTYQGFTCPPKVSPEQATRIRAAKAEGDQAVSKQERDRLRNASIPYATKGKASPPKASSDGGNCTAGTHPQLGVVGGPPCPPFPRALEPPSPEGAATIAGADSVADSVKEAVDALAAMRVQQNRTMRVQQNRQAAIITRITEPVSTPIRAVPVIAISSSAGSALPSDCHIQFRLRSPPRVMPKAMPKVMPSLPPKARPTLKRKVREMPTHTVYDGGTLGCDKPLVVQLVTAGWKNMHKLKDDVPRSAEPAPAWCRCPNNAEMTEQLKRLVCQEALQACQLMCCVIYSIYIYMYVYQASSIWGEV
jgi:hypothetical protein